VSLVEESCASFAKEKRRNFPGTQSSAYSGQPAFAKQGLSEEEWQKIKLQHC
jgi:hypothetical protein